MAVVSRACSRRLLRPLLGRDAPLAAAPPARLAGCCFARFSGLLLRSLLRRAAPLAAAQPARPARRCSAHFSGLLLLSLLRCAAPLAAAHPARAAGRCSPRFFGSSACCSGCCSAVPLRWPLLCLLAPLLRSAAPACCSARRLLSLTVRAGRRQGRNEGE